MTKRHERNLARFMAVQVLYQSEITGREIDDIIEDVAPVPDGGSLPDYACDLLEGVKEHRDDIDEKIDESSENWSIARMPVVDRAIMRMAVYEMLYVDDVPVSVCINEAVEIAKKLGGEDDSARFANGILGRISRTWAASSGKPDEPASSQLEDEATGLHVEEETNDGE